MLASEGEKDKEKDEDIEKGKELKKKNIYDEVKYLSMKDHKCYSMFDLNSRPD